MYTLVDGVEFYDKDEVDDIVRAITGGSLPNEDGIRNELTTKIDAEAAEREQADTALRAELGARIDEETVAREAATAANKSLIDLETQSRAAVDALLSNQLAAIEQLHTTLIGPNGFVDSDGDTVKANDSGKSIRQIAHEEFYRQLITDADDVKTQLDTLKELADYLQRNPSVLTDMYNKLGITWSVDNPTDFGTFNFSAVLTATNVDDAVLELYNTFTDKIGDLAQLTTTFKDSVVGAINELDSTIKSKVYTDVKTVAFTPTSPDVPPTALNNTTKHFAASTTATFADVYAKLSDDMQSFIAILDIDKHNRIYASVAQITDTSITFCSTRCITKVTDSATVNTYQDTTINWFNDGSADVIITDDYTATRIDEEVTARTDADTALGTRIDEEVGDLDSLKTTEKSSAVAAINELYDTVQQGGGDSPVPAPSADTPYIIEITTDTLDAPATVLGDLSPDAVTGIQAAVAANRPLAVKLMRTDDPADYTLLPMYSSVPGASMYSYEYIFTRSGTTIQDHAITITNYVIRVRPDQANYAGQITRELAPIPEGGSEQIYVIASTYTDPKTGDKTVTSLSHTYDEIVAEVVKDRPVILKLDDSYLPLVGHAPTLGFDYDPLVFAYCLGSVSTEDRLHYVNVFVSKDGDGDDANTTAILLSGEVDGGGGGAGVAQLETKLNEEVTARTDADTALGTRIDTEVGTLSALTTTAKDNVVAAINEVNGKVGAGVEDTSEAIDVTYNITTYKGTVIGTIKGKKIPLTCGYYHTVLNGNITNYSVDSGHTAITIKTLGDDYLDISDVISISCQKIVTIVGNLFDSDIQPVPCTCALDRSLITIYIPSAKNGDRLGLSLTILQYG